jgi:EAL domain-containing protein (putative c-di-GMP-specific phosphodiesterase class I)
MLNARLRVLAITLAQQHAWRAEGWQIPVSMNVSARCIRNPEFALVIRQVLKTWDGDAGQLAVRDPGECAGQEPDRGLADARADRRSGVRAGARRLWHQSALLVLFTQAAGAGAQDRPLLRGRLTRDEDAATIVRSAISLGKSLGLSVIAEGVEDQGTLDELREMGCDHEQGHFIATPLSSTALAEWLRQQAGAPAPQEVDA